MKLIVGERAVEAVISPTVQAKLFYQLYLTELCSHLAVFECLETTRDDFQNAGGCTVLCFGERFTQFSALQKRRAAGESKGQSDSTFIARLI